MDDENEEHQTRSFVPMIKTDDPTFLMPGSSPTWKQCRRDIPAASMAGSPQIGGVPTLWRLPWRDASGLSVCPRKAA
jgi:hypothetical protein